MSEWQQLGHSEGFRDFLDRLARKVHITNEDLGSTWCGVCERQIPTDKDIRHCSQCHFDVRAGEHGYLRAAVADHYIATQTTLIPCDECLGQSNYQDIRRRKQFATLMASAALPSRFSTLDLNTFKQSCAGEVEKQKALDTIVAWINGELADIGFRSLFLCGPVGTGKTGLAIAALKAQLYKGRAGVYITTPDMLDRLRASYDEKSTEPVEDLLQSLSEIDILLLDDIGSERMTGWAREKLFQLLDARMRNKRSTLFTSNQTMQQVFAGDERLQERLSYECWECEVGGINLRRRITPTGRPLYVYHS